MGQDPDTQGRANEIDVHFLDRMGNYDFSTRPFELMRDDIKAIASILADLIEADLIARVADLEKARAGAEGRRP